MEFRVSEYQPSYSLVIYLQQRVSTEPTTSYRLQGLRPNSLYLFRLAARSPQGLGASTAEISAKTMQSSRCLSLKYLFSLFLFLTETNLSSPGRQKQTKKQNTIFVLLDAERKKKSLKCVYLRCIVIKLIQEWLLHSFIKQPK